MAVKPFSQALFDYLCTIAPMAGVELVVRQRDDAKAVLLTKRAPDDRWWPDTWHIPGGYIWYRETIQHALQRIAVRELGTRLVDVRFLGVIEYVTKADGPRNHSVVAVYQGYPATTPSDGKFFRIDKIPKNFIPAQHQLIAMMPKP